MTLMYQPLPIVSLLFAASLVLTMGASAWFTRRLEAVCDALNLPPSLLSLLGALGANIPNYVASIVAIAGGHLDVGLGIIIGSNIYNVAIILSIATFATPKHHGILLTFKEEQDECVPNRKTSPVRLSTAKSSSIVPTVLPSGSTITAYAAVSGIAPPDVMAASFAPRLPRSR